MHWSTIILLLGAALAYTNGHYLDKFRRQEEPNADESVKEDIVEAFDCKRKDEECWGIPKCCGYLICTKGVVGKGTCEDCIEENEKCHADWQCCQDTQCDKQEPIHINGACKPVREEGADCFENSQCAGYCDRHLFHIWGKCRSS